MSLFTPPDQYDQFCEQWQHDADAADYAEEHGETVEDAKERAIEAKLDAQLEREAFEK